jgi:hypothetical protein
VSGAPAPPDGFLKSLLADCTALQLPLLAVKVHLVQSTFAAFGLRGV